LLEEGEGSLKPADVTTRDSEFPETVKYHKKTLDGHLFPEKSTRRMKTVRIGIESFPPKLQASQEERWNARDTRNAEKYANAAGCS
jgi:hypothetical protein